MWLPYADLAKMVKSSSGRSASIIPNNFKYNSSKMCNAGSAINLVVSIVVCSHTQIDLRYFDSVTILHGKF